MQLSIASMLQQLSANNQMLHDFCGALTNKKMRLFMQVITSRQHFVINTLENCRDLDDLENKTTLSERQLDKFDPASVIQKTVQIIYTAESSKRSNLTISYINDQKDVWDSRQDELRSSTLPAITQ